MTQLFKHRWASQEGEVKSVDGSLSENFNLWARKTSGLTDSEWVYGFEELERRIEKESSQGNTLFPPTYAEFLGICKPSNSPDGINGAAYKEFKPAKALVDMGAKDRSDEARRKAMGSMFK